MLASHTQRFRLECRGLNELSAKVFKLARQADRECVKEGVDAAPTRLTGLGELLVGNLQSSVDRMDVAGREMRACEGWPDIGGLGECDCLAGVAETTLEGVPEEGREGHLAERHCGGHLVAGSSGEDEHAFTFFVRMHEIARHHVDVR